MSKAASGKQAGERVKEGASFPIENPSHDTDLQQTTNIATNCIGSTALIGSSDYEHTTKQIDENLSLHRRKIRCEEIKNPLFHKKPLSKKIIKCRERFRKRKAFAKSIEATCINDNQDSRPYAKIYLGELKLFGLLDSGASISVLGKGCNDLLKKLKIEFTPIFSSLKTADGGCQRVIGFAEIPVTFKNVTRNILFYLSPTLQQPVYLGINFWKLFDIYMTSSENMHCLTDFQLYDLKRVVDQFPSFKKLGLGRTSLEVHSINTGDSEPFKIKHYPLSPPRQEEAYRELDRMLSLGGYRREQ